MTKAEAVPRQEVSFPAPWVCGSHSPTIPAFNLAFTPRLQATPSVITALAAVASLIAIAAELAVVKDLHGYLKAAHAALLPSPTSLVLTLLLASPFQWFTVAGAKTFRIPRCSDSGAGWGGTAFLFGHAHCEPDTARYWRIRIQHDTIHLHGLG